MLAMRGDLPLRRLGLSPCSCGLALAGGEVLLERERFSLKTRAGSRRGGLSLAQLSDL